MKISQEELFRAEKFPSHPARYTEALLPIMAAMLRGRKRIIDPFAGSGRCFLFEKFIPDCEVSGTEIEPEWAAMHPRTTLGSALALPWADGYFDAVCTSPTYGNRMSDHHNAKDASRRRTDRDGGRYERAATPDRRVIAGHDRDDVVAGCEERLEGRHGDRGAPGEGDAQ